MLYPKSSDTCLHQLYVRTLKFNRAKNKKEPYLISKALHLILVRLIFYPFLLSLTCLVSLSTFFHNLFPIFYHKRVHVFHKILNKYIAIATLLKKTPFGFPLIPKQPVRSQKNSQLHVFKTVKVKFIYYFAFHLIFLSLL
jgi:hypothetical protein